MPQLNPLSDKTNDELFNLVTDGKATNNPHIWAAVAKIDRIIKELSESRAANNTSSNTFDLSRAKSYIKDLEGYFKYVSGEPMLDYVKSHPDGWALPDEQTVPNMESEDVALALVDMLRIRRELAKSQSGRDPSGIRDHDYTRLKTFTAKATAFISEYIEPKAEPKSIDYPESASSAPQTDTNDRSVKA